MTGDPAPALQRARLEPLVQVGEGGQGFVHLTEAVKINKQWPVAYKEYKPGTTFDPAMLARMVGFVPGLDRDTGRWLCETTAWPAALIGRGGDVCGFLMRRIPDDFQQPWGEGGATVPAAMQYLLNPQQYLDRKQISIDDAQRLALLEDIADTLSRLHSLGVVVGDLSPNNLLVHLAGRPRCFLIDCDAMRLRGDDVLEQVETPEWRVPGPHEPNATPASDSYKFGLLAVRLFAQDQMGADPAALDGMSAELGVLARLSLDLNSTVRPAPGDWLAALRSAQRGPAYLNERAGVTVPDDATTTVLTSPADPPPARIVGGARVRKQSAWFGGAGNTRTIGIMVLAALILLVLAVVSTLAGAST